MVMVRNKCMRLSLNVAPLTDKVRSSRLALCGHVIRRKECHATRRVLTWRGKSKKKMDKWCER